ncbi:MAG: hypothetical protein ACRENH_11275 [Gemmatimonadaceae bacterium]
MAEAAELLAVIEQAVAAFRHEGITYFITGSLASSVHGEFRATNDVDLVAEVTPANVGALIDRLTSSFFVDREAAIEAVASRAAFNAIHKSTYLKLDVFPCDSAFDREAARRAESMLMPGAAEPLRVATKEDILLAKLRWYRLGDEQSEVQRRDIRQLLALNRDALDSAYLGTWANVLGVADLLQHFERDLR